MAETAYTLNITVRNKIATITDPATVVNGNNDYTVVFDFDSEWDSLSSKTAMFVYGREEQKYKTVAFTGNSCVMPALYNTGYVLIGVFAGNIKTTSAAYVKCIPCIKDNDSTLDTGGGGTIDTGTTDHSKLGNRDAADQHPISAITGLEEALTPLTGTTETITPTQVYDAIKSGKSVVLQHTISQLGLFTFASFNIFEGDKAVVSTSIMKYLGGYLVGSLVGSAGSNEWVFNVTEMAEADDIPVAVNEALAQAKASGEFDGADGKSAYAYAVEGGYTGTEAEFAAKLAQEKFANPNALTFTGAVEGSYDGSEPMTVNIPSGGSGGSSQWKIIRDLTISENADRVDINKDNDGNTFALHEIHVFSYTQSYADSSEMYTFLLNGFWALGDPYFSSGFKSTASSDNYYAENHFIATMQNGFANVFQPWKGGILGAIIGGDVFSFGDKYQTIESVSFVGKFITGCRFILVGRVTL